MMRNFVVCVRGTFFLEKDLTFKFAFPFLCKDCFNSIILTKYKFFDFVTLGLNFKKYKQNADYEIDLVKS